MKWLGKLLGSTALLWWGGLALLMSFTTSHAESWWYVTMAFGGLGAGLAARARMSTKRGFSAKTREFLGVALLSLSFVRVFTAGLEAFSMYPLKGVFPFIGTVVYVLAWRQSLQAKVSSASDPTVE